MKKVIQIVVIAVIFVCSPLLTNTLFADTPPDPGGGPGTGDDPVGGGSPIGGGLFIMIALGAAYGGKKIYDASKDLK